MELRFRPFLLIGAQSTMDKKWQELNLEKLAFMTFKQEGERSVLE
jgi:hypothetical protein